MILLHGFPEFWYGWRNQIPALASAGWRVFAPDQRGYPGSDKPGKLRRYALDELVADVIGLIDGAGRERAFVVGHDWGGVVAWWAASRHPDRIAGAVILNAPHPAAMRRALLRDRQQRRRSRYMFWFQLPWLPEWLLGRDDFRLLVRTLRSSSREGTFSPAEITRYREAWSTPGTLTGMLAWYRALRYAWRLRVDAPVRPETLVLWGSDDRFLGEDLAEVSVARCERGELETVADATHWIQHEEPERVNERLLTFLAGRKARRGS